MLLFGCNSMGEKVSIGGGWKSGSQVTEWGSLVHEIVLKDEHSVEYRMVFFPDDPAEIVRVFTGWYEIKEDGRVIFDFSSEGIDFSHHDTLTGRFDKDAELLRLDVANETITLKRDSRRGS